MKEVLTKKFWQDVKKTFDEARQDSGPDQIESKAPTEPAPDTAPADNA